jgi:hypothetical protein
MEQAAKSSTGFDRHGALPCYRFGFVWVEATAPRRFFASARWSKRGRVAFKPNGRIANT